MKSFTAYTGVLLPCVPKILLPLFAWAATIAEIILGILLLIGFQKRLVALLSGILLLTFAFSMLFSLNIKAPLDYSVFALPHVLFYFTKRMELKYHQHLKEHRKMLFKSLGIN